MMKHDAPPRKPPKCPPDLSRLFPGGRLDLSRLPLEPIEMQAVSDNDSDFHSACGTLVCMARAGRLEAAIFLTGLLRWYRGDLKRMKIAAESLGSVNAAPVIEVLFDELTSIRLSTATRAYVNTVIGALSKLSPDLVLPRFDALAADMRLSPKMRQKLRAAIDEIERRKGTFLRF